MRVRLRLIERDDGLGSAAGVRAAVHGHSGELYGFALRALGDPGLAEEVVQETFVRAWRAGRRFDPNIASLRTWLFAILRNVIVDATRARSIRPGVGVAVDVAVADNLDELLRSWVVEDALFRPGTARRNWKNTLLSDGHVIVRHPDWHEAHRLSFAAATGIKMYAGG